MILKKGEYDEQLKKLYDPWQKRRVRKLCEKGLISKDDRRLSRGEGEIKHKFGISKDTLDQLISFRLLRSEPRLDSVYYELSHDNLVAPIRESQNMRSFTNNITSIGILIGIILIFLFIMNFDIKSANIGPYLEIGKIFYDDKDFEAAIKIYNKALEKDIKDASLYYYLGQAYLKKNKLKEAIEIYNESLKITKKNSEVHKELALAYIKNSEPEKAIRVYEDALSYNPDFADIYEEIFEEFKRKRDKSRAIKILDITSNVYSKKFPIFSKKISILSKKFSIFMKVGDDYSELNMYSQAVENYKKATAIEPDSYYPYYKLGITFCKQGKYEEAIDAYEKAKAVDPEKFPAKVALADVYLITDRFENALNISNLLLEEKDISTDNKLVIRFIYITSLFFQGKELEAIEQLKEFINIYISLSGDYARSWDYIG